jgi:8-oxo-dGTP pyrophosphatase MutT (NUDIX family)
LQRRFDNALWALPGGTMDLGERIAQTVVREAREETGLDVEVTGIVGIYSDPGHIIAYSDGEVRQEFNVCFAARLVGGQLSVSAESTEVRWVAPRAIEDLPMHESIRLRIKHFLEHRPTPAIA